MWGTTLNCTTLRGWTFAASRCQPHRYNQWEQPSCWPSFASNIWTDQRQCGYPTQNLVKNFPGMWPKHHTKQNVENILTRSVKNYNCVSKITLILFQSHVPLAETFMFETMFLKRGVKPVCLSVCRLQRVKLSVKNPALYFVTMTTEEIKSWTRWHKNTQPRLKHGESWAHFMNPAS